jgi:hypothetical protein
MGSVGVPDEARVQRLDPVQPLWAEVGGVLGWRTRRLGCPGTLGRESTRAHTDATLVFGHDAEVLAELKREKAYD